VIKIIIPSLVVLSILISGCNLPERPSASSPAFTAVPTLSLTETTQLIASLAPTGQPVNEWNGIPIMSGALAGEEKDGVYRFTTPASPEEIEVFYNRELSQRGWELAGTKEGNAGAVLLIFSNADDTVSISILPDQNKFLVVIVK
jgi:hypothetical protein